MWSGQRQRASASVAVDYLIWARVQKDFAALLVESLTYGLHRQERALLVSDVQHDAAFGAVPRGVRWMDTVAVGLAADVGRLLGERLQILAAGPGRPATVAEAAGARRTATVARGAGADVTAGHVTADASATTHQERESACGEKARLPHCPSNLARQAIGLPPES